MLFEGEESGGERLGLEVRFGSGDVLEDDLCMAMVFGLVF